MFKKLIVILMTMFLLALTACGGGTPAPAQPDAPSESADAGFSELKLTISHSHPTSPDDDVHFLCTQFAEYVGEATDSKVTFDIVGDGVLGGDTEAMEAVGLGTVDIVAVPNVTVSNKAPSHQILAMPFLFRNYDDIHKFLDSDIMTDINEDVYTQANGKVLTVGDGGFRHSINNVRPIVTVDDYHGLKWRVMESPLTISLFNLLGANPTPISGSEMFTALQQGTVDGLDLPLSSMVTMQIYTAGKYVDLTSHQFTGWYLIVTRNIWDGLPANVQEVFLEAAGKAVVDQRERVVAAEETRLVTMEESGNIINRNVDTSTMQAAVEPLYDEYRDAIGADVFDRTRELLQTP